MSKKMFRSEDFKTPPCRVSYAQGLFKARASEDGGKEKFGCTLIFKNEDRAALDKAVRDCIVGEWGDKGVDMAKNGLIKSPFLAGDGKEARNKTTGELHPGMGPEVFFIRPSSIYEPAVRYRSANVQASPEEVYSGCFGFAVLNVFAWSNPKNGNGVSFGIQYFQKTGDGERLGGGGGVDVNKYFEKIEDAGDAPASTQNGQGAAGLFG
jgi:hypothetical protein